MKKITIVLLLMFVALINCFAQNNNYQLQPENTNYNPRGFLDAAAQNLERAKEGHQQGQNQIWSDLERINNFVKQGDYANADLLIDRCIQLNAQWQYHLIDHSILTGKKTEIANAKNNTRTQNYNRGTNNNRNNNSLGYSKIPDCYSLATLIGKKDDLKIYLQSNGFKYNSIRNIYEGVNGAIKLSSCMVIWYFPNDIKNQIKSDITYFAQFLENTTIRNSYNFQNTDYQVYSYKSYILELSIAPGNPLNNNESLFELKILILYPDNVITKNINNNNFGKLSDSDNAFHTEMFNTYLDIARKEYNEKNYKGARNAIDAAFELFFGTEMHLTDTEIERYNQLYNELNLKSATIIQYTIKGRFMSR